MVWRVSIWFEECLYLYLEITLAARFWNPMTLSVSVLRPSQGFWGTRAIFFSGTGEQRPTNKGNRRTQAILGFLYKGRVIYFQLGGAGYIQGGGVRIFFGDELGGGLKIKCISSGICGGGGSDVFRWSFISLKVIASGGQSPQTPLYPISILSFFLDQWGDTVISSQIYRLSSVLEC